MNNILENSISNIDDDLIEMTAQKLMSTRPRKTALNIAKFAGIAAAAAALCIAVRVGITQYNDRVLNSTVSGSDPANSAAGDAVIMPLEDFVKLSDEQATELLRGFTYDELVLAWGGSMQVTSARIRERWKCGDKIVSVEFEPDGEKFVWYVRDVSIFDVEETHPLDFKAQNIRTNLLQYDPAPSFPETVLIKDRGELEKYYADNSDKYNLKWDDPDCFYQAVLGGYNDDFFKDHCLLFVVVQEGSGSNGHYVKKVEYSAENNTLNVAIDRIVPNVGTCDMAEWHIVIELDARYGGAASVNVTQNTLAVDLAPEPDTDQDPFFSGNGVSYVEIMERGFEKDLGFKVKNTEHFPGFKKYLPLLLYHDNEKGDVYELTYIFDDLEISASRYDIENVTGLLDGKSLILYEYKGYKFYMHPAHPNIIVSYLVNDVVYYCLFADPNDADEVKDRIIEIINVPDHDVVDVPTDVPDTKPDFFSGEKDCSYADILNRGYENSLGFRVKNMEQRPDFKKYSA